MFPSSHSMKSFDIILNPGDTIQQVTIQVYNEWNKSLTDDDVDEIRFNVLGVQTSVSMPFDINAYVTDDRLIEMDGELESKDDNNLVRLPKESRRRQTYDFDEARVGASGADSMEEIPLFSTSIITITSSSSGRGLRRVDSRITIQLLT